MFSLFQHCLGRRRIRPGALLVGSYLTDGRRLFRVASRLDAGCKQVLVALEDCLTLEIRGYSLSELDEMELSAVRTAKTVAAPLGEVPQIYEAGEDASAITHAQASQASR